MTYQRPFLKWAGNKYQVLAHLLPHIPNQGARFIEPFAGSGSVFLNLKLSTSHQFQDYHVNDSNPDLVGLYNAVKTDPAGFITRCNLLFNGDPKLGIPNGNLRAQYEHLRDVFNKKKTDAVLTSQKITRSELFVYLNRHCFNGLCRYNSKGEFNVPFGRYKAPQVPADDVHVFGKASTSNVHYTVGDYETLLAALKPGKGDVIYLDPPYVPLSATAGFTDYSNDGGFPMSKQKALATAAENAAKKGAIVIVSNHDTPTSRDLYKNAKTIYAFDAPRFIGGGKKAPELIAVFKI